MFDNMKFYKTVKSKLSLKVVLHIPIESDQYTAAVV